MFKILSFIFWYFPVLVVQLISSRVTISNIDPWYRELQKPFWNPPDGVFAPVWTLLYLMMGAAVWLVYWSKGTWKAYILFFTQLFLNGLWSVLFFGFHAPGWALLDLGLLVGILAWNLVVFARIRPLAGWLLLPYLLWTVYAITLNMAIWWLN